jgi:hypothetical protein
MRPGAEAQNTRGTLYRSRLRSSSQGWTPVICHLVILVFPLALLWRPLFAGEAFFWGTPLLQFVPWQQLAADMWRSGHLPLWNPLVGCGAPLAANYQAGAFYPLNALYLLMEAEVAMSWTVAVHLALVGWGMYRWGQVIGMEPFPALLGALALEGSGFVVGRAALFPSIAVTFPWIPIWLSRTEVLLQAQRRQPESRGAALRSTLWLGLTLGLGLLAGHAQTAFYGGLLVAAYAIFRALQNLLNEGEGRARGGQEQGGLRSPLRHSTRTMLLLVLALVLGLGLAGVQLLPTAELLVHSQRSGGVEEEFALTYSFWPWRLITLLAPSFFGNPGQGNYWGYGAHWEDALYVGLLPLLLAIGAIIGAWSRRDEKAGDGGVKPGGTRNEPGPGRRPSPLATSTVDLRASTWFWAAGALLTLILALGQNTPVFPFLFRHVPSFDLFQAPSRWLAVTTVALSALTAIGAQRWSLGLRAKRLGELGATIGTALLIGGAAAPHLVPDIPATFGPATIRLGLGLILIGILSLFRGRGGWARGGGGAWWQAGAVALLALDLLTFGYPLVPTVDRSLYQGKTETAAVLRKERDLVRVYWPSDPIHQDRAYDAQYRVKFDYLTFEDFGPRSARYWRGMRSDQLPNAGMLDGIASANNFDPLLVGEFVDLLEAAVETPSVLKAMGVTHVVSDRPWPNGDTIHATDSATFYRLRTALERAWIVPRARLVSSDQALAAMRNRSFDPADVVFVDKGAEGLGGDAQGELSASSLILQDGPNQVTIQAALDASGYLVLADIWYPGWQAVVDGETAKIVRANHAFRAIHLTAGEHTIEMTYRPISVLVGGGITLTTGILLVLGLLVSWRRKPRVPRLRSGGPS